MKNVSIDIDLFDVTSVADDALRLVTDMISRVLFSHFATHKTIQFFIILQPSVEITTVKMAIAGIRYLRME